jgi:hypothetical protein
MAVISFASFVVIANDSKISDNVNQTVLVRVFAWRNLVRDLPNDHLNEMALIIDAPKLMDQPCLHVGKYANTLRECQLILVSDRLKMPRSN